MNRVKKKLERHGWRVGSVGQFLGLTEEEAAFVDLKLVLARELRDHRGKRRWTQTQLATHLGTSQSRVAKMEAADASVSLDLVVRALLALAVSRPQLARAMTKPVKREAA
jgi:predicted XRE-type DNA-binding protein